MTARRLRARALAAATAALLGAGVAVLAACGSSGGGLIPAVDGGPLQSDVEAVERAAESGNGNCSATDAALQKAEQDYAKLPSSVASALRDKIHLGLENLDKVAKEACAQPVASTQTNATPPKTTSTATTQTQTAPPASSTPSTSRSTPAPAPKPKEEEAEEEVPGAGGGTPAPGEGNGSPPGAGSGGAGAEEPGNGAAGGGGLEGSGR